MVYNMQNKHAETRLTIICLSYERQPMMRRQLLYYSNRPLHVIFADGSAKPWALGYQGSIGTLTWEYFNITGYDSYVNRIAESISRVKTEYVAFIDDEECLLWTGLRRAMDFLDIHSEHICAGGMVCMAGADNGKSFVSPWGRWSVPWSLTDPDPLNRFAEMSGAERTGNLYYQVFRRKDLEHYNSIIPTFLYRYLSGLEILFTGFLTLSGYWEMGDYPFWIRNGGSVANPSNALNYISEEEMRDVSQRLSSLYDSNPSGVFRAFTQGSKEAVANAIYMIIDAQWGKEAQMKKNNVSTVTSKWLPEFVLIMIRKLLPLVKKWTPPSIVTFLKHLITTLKRLKGARQDPKMMAFESYALRNSNGNFLVLQDMLLIKSIWETYPKGVLEDKDLFAAK
ncbi:MAG: TIGR00180 family glycosyltransferase [Candidatus Riflebacteria bacterium]|nr:TIGR00180 family glycosyltransferase [Candidatus Riflebacteria bacterium]